jgi:hypothetical protein
MVCGRTGRPIGRASVQKQPTTRPRLAAGAKVNSEFRIMDVFLQDSCNKVNKNPHAAAGAALNRSPLETAVRVV